MASPSLRPATPTPHAAIMPAPSWPGMKGSGGLPGHSPFAAWRSVWQTPVATTLMRTSPGPGVGIGTSSMVNGRPKACTRAALIVPVMHASPFFSQARFTEAGGGSMIPAELHCGRSLTPLAAALIRNWQSLGRGLATFARDTDLRAALASNFDGGHIVG